MTSLTESQFSLDPQSQYDQEVKKDCRSRLIEHAVRCLTTERDTSVCVRRDHVAKVWSQLLETGEVQHYFTQPQQQQIEEEIKQWEIFHDSQIQTRKPSDLRVCYLGGDNPINDLEVLIDNGVLTQNVWAIEKHSATLQKAWESISRSNLRNVRLFKGDILNFLKDFEGQFDIIYYDACGTLPASKQNTLKFIGYVFLYNKLTSPGALITNFSFSPKQNLKEDHEQQLEQNPKQEPEQAAQKQNAATQAVGERKLIRGLSEEYLKYRLVNASLDENVPELNAERLLEMTDEEIYSDYITYQVIDSAYLYIPAQRMLSSSRSGSSCPLWEQMFVSKDSFLNKVKTYVSNAEQSKGRSKYATATNTFTASASSTANKSKPTSESPSTGKSSTTGESNATSKSSESQLNDLLIQSNNQCKETASESYLQKIGSTMNAKSSNNCLCKAWVSEIFPDWKSSASELKSQEISPMLLTHLLSCSENFILRFSNQDFQKKCLGPLAIARSPDQSTSTELLPVGSGTFPMFCDVPDIYSTTSLVAGLLYGQMAYPSFPVVNKLLRLSYTARKRQMFSDVFIFDKCRYVYEQFPSVDCSVFAIFEMQQQMVFRMVVDGLRKHLMAICNEDVFRFCNVASINAMTDGGVNFEENSAHSIPVRQKVELLLFSKLKEVEKA